MASSGASKRVRNDADGAFRPIDRSLLEPAVDPVPIDHVDLTLLKELSSDARLSQRQLAKAVEMSATAVGERIARLERLGVLKRYTVEVDWARLGLPVVVYLPVVAAAGTDLGELLEQLSGLPEAESVSIVSGAYDLLALLHVRDTQHLADVLLDRIWPLPNLQRIETLLCLAATRQKNFTEELLSHLLESATARSETRATDRSRRHNS